MTFHFQWHFSFGDIKFSVTFTFKWHFSLSDNSALVTFQFEWHFSFSAISVSGYFRFSDISVPVTFQFYQHFMSFYQIGPLGQFGLEVAMCKYLYVPSAKFYLVVNALLSGQKNYPDKKIVRTKNYPDKKIVRTKKLSDKKFGWTKKMSGKKKFWTKKMSRQKNCLDKIVFVGVVNALDFLSHPALDLLSWVNSFHILVQ